MKANPAPAFLATKLNRPRLSSDVVSRPHLLEQLDRGLRQQLILVSAPAGFGKTTLVCDWLQRSLLPAAWVSLDESDSDPATFCRYLVAAVQTVFANACAQTLA